MQHSREGLVLDLGKCSGPLRTTGKKVRGLAFLVTTEELEMQKARHCLCAADKDAGTLLGERVGNSGVDYSTDGCWLAGRVKALG